MICKERTITNFVLGISAIALVACETSVKSTGGSPDSPISQGGEIQLGQEVLFEGEAKASSDAPTPYTHLAGAEYSLVLAEETDVTYNDQSSGWGCLEGYSAAGPFVTLFDPEGASLTTDTVAYPGLAVTPTTFKKTLPKGAYKIQVLFYADSESCMASLEFKFDETPLQSGDDGLDDSGAGDGTSGDGGSGDNGGSDGSGDGGTGTDDGDDLHDLDSALIGTWTSITTEGGWEIKQQIVVQPSASGTQFVSVAGDTILDQDIAFSSIAAAAQLKRVQMKVTDVRVDESDEPASVGASYLCVYTISGTAPNRSLQMSCSEPTNTSYPDSLADAVLFSEGTGTSPPPLPPEPGTIVRELTGLNLAIPDANASGVTQAITVTEDFAIKDVVVGVNITHTYVSDLRVSLISPSGTEVLLHSNTGGNGTNLVVTYGTGGVPAAGDLSTFVGQTSAGIWQLKIVDDAAEDTGALRSVKLEISH